MTDRLNPEALDQHALEAAACAVNAAHTYDYLTPWDVLVTSDDKANRFRVKRDREYARAAVSAYLAALPAPRTITTVEELGALPGETVIQDFNDDIMQIIELDNDDTSTGERGGVREFGFEEGRFEFLSWVKLPALVLWVPAEGGGE